MKTKFFLMLLALNGLCLGANSLFPATASAASHHDVADLSQTISQLVDLGPDSHSLVASAIDRALLARDIKANGNPDVLINGIIYNPNPQPEPFVNGKIINPNPQPQPIINGRIANPNPPLITGKIKVGNPYRPPFIFGRIANPNPPLITGKIANPNPQPPILINGTMIRVDQP
jgi:hypothetical protein